MGFLFWKSKEERRLERDLQVRKGIATLEKQARGLEADLEDYKKLAVDAKRIGSEGQLAMVCNAIKRPLAQLRMSREQFLAIKTAQKIKAQAETHSEFANAMNAVSRAIADVFGSTDLIATQRNFEKAMLQADTMQQRMELFLDSATEAMSVSGDVDKLVSDEEVRRMIDDLATSAEKDALGKRISEGMDKVREELGR